MPASYAHYRFGQQVFKQLPVELQQQISPYMDLYQIGLHGPDLLFYYHPLIPNFAGTRTLLIYMVLSAILPLTGPVTVISGTILPPAMSVTLRLKQSLTGC